MCIGEVQPLLSWHQVTSTCSRGALPVYCCSHHMYVFTSPSSRAGISSISCRGAVRTIRGRPSMSADGCQQPAWTGQAFSYLMHHPSASSGERVHYYVRSGCLCGACNMSAWPLTKPAVHAALHSFCRATIDRGQRGRCCSCSRQSGQTMFFLCALALAAETVQDCCASDKLCNDNFVSICAISFICK